MSGAAFILAINLATSGCIAAAFAAIAAYDPRHVAARWIAATYGLGVAYLAVEAAIPGLAGADWAVVLSFGLFLGATLCFNIGLGHAYGVRSPLWQMGLFLVLAMVAVHLVQSLPRQSLLRMLTYQLPFAAMQLAAMATVLASARAPRPLDWLLAATLAVNAVQFASKPLLATSLGGWGDTPQHYLASVYALVSQSLGTVLAIATALITMAVLARDILAEMQARSETDMLSGLLNRRGFERRAAETLRDAGRLGMPVSLVVADIDWFKAVNDTFGHAAGDRVIAAFAYFLRSATAGSHVAGRIGGEEFAVLLPGTNLVAARLFAEGARGAFSAMRIEGFPDEKGFTASFGVTELKGEETIGDLMARADTALYAAKLAGRDCVRVTVRSPARPAGAAISLG